MQWQHLSNNEVLTSGECNEDKIFETLDLFVFDLYWKVCVSTGFTLKTGNDSRTRRNGKLDLNEFRFKLELSAVGVPLPHYWHFTTVIIFIEFHESHEKFKEKYHLLSVLTRHFEKFSKYLDCLVDNQLPEKMNLNFMLFLLLFCFDKKQVNTLFILN